jgi:hypothetical protein
MQEHDENGENLEKKIEPINMVWEISDDQHTRPFSDPPDPNRVIVLVEGTLDEEDRQSICIGKYKGHGRMTGVLDQGVLYYLPNLSGTYKVRLNNSPREYAIHDQYSWYYLSEDTSDESAAIQEGVAEGKEREVKLLIREYFNACHGQDQARKDALFHELDPIVQERIHRTLHNFDKLVKDKPNEVKRGLFQRLHPELRHKVRTRVRNQTDSMVALMKSTGTPRDTARHIMSFKGSSRKTRRRKRI